MGKGCGRGARVQGARVQGARVQGHGKGYNSGDGTGAATAV